jgi:hypothetical protein
MIANCSDLVIVPTSSRIPLRNRGFRLATSEQSSGQLARWPVGELTVSDGLNPSPDGPCRQGEPHEMAVRGRCRLTRTAHSDAVEVDPVTLLAETGRRSALQRWNATYAKALSDWPRSGGFESERDVEQFVNAGQELVARLQVELAPSYHVEYMREPIRPPGVKLRPR